MNEYKMNDGSYVTLDALKKIYDLKQEALLIIKYFGPELTSATPFICGAHSKKGDTLPERVQICAAYGSDYTAVYQRVYPDEI